MRGSVALAGVIASGLVSLASAQEPDVTALQLKACTLVNDDAARVRCYDQAMSRPASAPRLVNIPPSIGSGSDVPLVAIPQQTPTVTAKPHSAAETAAVALPPAEPPPAAKPEPSSGFDARAILQGIIPSTSSSPSSATRSGNWQVGADKAVLPEASRLVGKLDSDDDSSLVLQCKDGNTEAHVSMKSFLGWESMRVVYRLNDNPAVEERWAAAADGRGAVAGNAVGFINSLTDGATLSVRVTDYNGADHALRFNLGGVANLRSQIALVCRWPGAVPDEKVAATQAPPSKRGAKSKPAATPAGAPLKLH